MDWRASRLGPATWMIVAALLVVSQAVGLPQSEAQPPTGAVVSGYCPSAEPLLETYCGQSLFWHDPCGSSYREPHYRPVHDSMAAPSWYASQEFVPLFRNQRGSQVFQAIAFAEVQEIFDPNDDLVDTIITYRREPVLGTDDFDTDFNAGIRLTLGRALGDWYRLEGSYLGSYEWSDSAAVWEPGGVLLSPFSNFGDPFGPHGLDDLSRPQLIPFPDPESEDGSFSGYRIRQHTFGPVTGSDPPLFVPDPDFDFNDYAQIDFRSRMSDGQINLRRRVRMDSEQRLRSETSWLLGLRYMNIGERFGYHATSPLPGRDPVSRDVWTENKMFGIQIGTLSQFLVVDRGWIDFEIKGVMFFNDASNRIETQFGPEPVWVSQAEKERTAFMGDLSLNFNYQFAPSWTFRAGYNGMWLTGLALASENFLVEGDPLLGDHRSSLDHSGRLVYHGPSLGLVFVH